MLSSQPLRKDILRILLQAKKMERKEPKCLVHRPRLWPKRDIWEGRGWGDLGHGLWGIHSKGAVHRGDARVLIRTGFKTSNVMNPPKRHVNGLWKLSPKPTPPQLRSSLLLLAFDVLASENCRAPARDPSEGGGRAGLCSPEHWKATSPPTHLIRD